MTTFSFYYDKEKDTLYSDWQTYPLDIASRIDELAGEKICQLGDDREPIMGITVQFKIPEFESKNKKIFHDKVLPHLSIFGTNEQPKLCFSEELCEANMI